jgi:hypothetical protein
MLLTCQTPAPPNDRQPDEGLKRLTGHHRQRDTTEADRVKYRDHQARPEAQEPPDVPSRRRAVRLARCRLPRPHQSRAREAVGAVTSIRHLRDWPRRRPASGVSDWSAALLSTNAGSSVCRLDRSQQAVAPASSDPNQAAAARAPVHRRTLGWAAPAAPVNVGCAASALPRKGARATKNPGDRYAREGIVTRPAELASHKRIDKRTLRRSPSRSTSWPPTQTSTSARRA